jgi:hypothetical protein
MFECGVQRNYGCADDREVATDEAQRRPRGVL